MISGFCGWFWRLGFSLRILWERKYKKRVKNTHTKNNFIWSGRHEFGLRFLFVSFHLVTQCCRPLSLSFALQLSFMHRLVRFHFRFHLFLSVFFCSSIRFALTILRFFVLVLSELGIWVSRCPNIIALDTNRACFADFLCGLWGFCVLRFAFDATVFWWD